MSATQEHDRLAGVNLTADQVAWVRRTFSSIADVMNARCGFTNGEHERMEPEVYAAVAALPDTSKIGDCPYEWEEMLTDMVLEATGVEPGTTRSKR